MTTTEPAPDQKEGLLYFAFYLWGLAVIAFAWVVLVFVPAFVPVFESVEIDLPAALVVAIDVAAWLGSPLGLTVMAVAAGLSILPFARGHLDRGLARNYLRGAGAVFATAVVTFACVMLPASRLEATLDGPAAAPSSSR